MGTTAAGSLKVARFILGCDGEFVKSSGGARWSGMVALRSQLLLECGHTL